MMPVSAATAGVLVLLAACGALPAAGGGGAKPTNISMFISTLEYVQEAATQLVGTSNGFTLSVGDYAAWDGVPQWCR